MTDRERLVELIGSQVCEEYSPTCDEYEPHTCEKCYANFYKVGDLADHIIADGWMRPPCKVGQTVYQTQPTRNRVQEYEVTAHKFNGSCYFFSWVLKDGKGIYENVEGFSEFQIGATVFLTREEAEKALKGGEDNG